MSRTVRIDEEVYRELQTRATPFLDTPNTVVRRLLGLPVSEADPVTDDTEESHTEARPVRSASRATPSRRSGRRKRAAKGSLLPETEYEMPILRIVEREGGAAPAANVVTALKVELSGKLKPIDHETLPSGRVRWENRAQFVRLKLVQRGDLKGGSPRGLWEITKQGRDRVGRTK